MTEQKTYRFIAHEDSVVELQARISDGVPTSTYPDDGTPLVNADFGSMTYHVQNLTTEAEVISSTALTVADVLADSLTDWGIDDVGWNFGWTIPATAFPDPHVFQVTLTLTPSSGNVSKSIFVYDTKQTAF